MSPVKCSQSMVGGLPGEPMSIFRQVGTNSAIYTATTLLQKGTAFLLLPLYTLYLDPAAYGMLAIVTAVNGFLTIFFTFGLTGAVTRFYFEFQDDPRQLARFWGSVLTFVFILSLLMGGAILVAGEVLLRPFIGNVTFWPHMAHGIFATLFQPFFGTFLAILQTRNQARGYALLSLAHFVLTTVLTIALVVFFRWGVTGALTAILSAAVVFFVVSLWLMRNDVHPCLRWRYLRPALAYGLPQLPHATASQITAISDRLVLNFHLGAAATGVYSVGSMVAMVIEVAAQGMNRAYVPLSMAALKRGTPQDLAQLRAIGAMVVAGFCLLGACVAAFGGEILHLLTNPAFASAGAVIPVLVFGGVASAIYYLLVNILFFDRNLIKILPVATSIAALLNVCLVLLLVPRFGLTGAASATLLAQVVATILVAWFGRRSDPVKWTYGRYAAAFVAALACGLGLSSLEASNLVLAGGAKLAGLLFLAGLLGSIFWNRPLIAVHAVVSVLRRRPGELAGFFKLAG